MLQSYNKKGKTERSDGYFIVVLYAHILILLDAGAFGGKRVVAKTEDILELYARP